MEVYREFLKKGDMVLLSLCLMASTFGVVMIYSATRWNNNDRAVIVQALATLIGVFLYILITAIDFEVLTKKFWRQIILFNVGFIALVLTPLGTDHDSGNLNWLSIPGVPLEIQPNEIVKMSFILVTAYIISRIQEDEQDISSLLSLSKLAAHAIMMLGVIALICGDMVE
ncbi:MAG: FtsW/RodA/SpoVE family cell cycle protein [Eubacteriales bacterium]